MKKKAKTARVKIWEELLKVARPDSKFSWQFSEFIADYEGSDKGAALLASTDMYKNAKVIFITPDNNLEKLRETAFRDKKTVVLTNYGITSGFSLIRLSPSRREGGGCLPLDGVSRYWKHFRPGEVKGVRPHRYAGNRRIRHHAQRHPFWQATRGTLIWNGPCYTPWHRWDLCDCRGGDMTARWLMWT